VGCLEGGMACVGHQEDGAQRGGLRAALGGWDGMRGASY
jgi:hypothetical protein